MLQVEFVGGSGPGLRCFDGPAFCGLATVGAEGVLHDIVID
jgi:hypothetical protein